MNRFERVVVGVAGVAMAGMLSFALASALSWIIEALFPPILLGPSASKGVFDGSRTKAEVAWLALVSAPLFETLFAPAAPMEVAHRMALPKHWGIAASATAFGLAHLIAGGPGHGFTMLCVGIVFAAVYGVYRRFGMITAFGAAAGAHIVHNGLALWLLH